nr:PH domain-containing protein [Kineococcus siccus]
MSVQAFLAVTRLVGEVDTFDVVLSIIQLLFFVAFLGAYFVWTPSTTLDADGVRLQNGFPRARVVRWAQVRDVQVQDRRQDVSQLLLEDGRSARLIGMPADDAQRLADALAARTER